MVREMLQSDSARVLEIYKMGLETGNSTFENTVPSWEEWDLKHHNHSRFVFVENNLVLGWIALAPVSTRDAYRGVAELSVYVDKGHQGKNIGSALMQKMIVTSESNGIWTLVSSVFPENDATIKLHQKFGFRIIGRRERIAMLDGKWRDTIMFEKRSSKW
jgi:L-amino acid N-acyltransferase YncA